MELKNREDYRCFIAIFGKKYAHAHPFNGGLYPLPTIVCPKSIREGDKD